MTAINLTSLSHVRALLEELNISPGKNMGQNFLIDRNILDILIDAADIGRDDTVLEVGPGLGVVTEEVARRAGHVIIVEKDRRLSDFLRSKFEGNPGLEVICADMLEVDIERLPALGVNKMVSNLPYSVGTRILVDQVKMADPLRCIVVTLQLEVANRLAAPVGTRDYGMLSVWAQLMYDIELVKVVSPTCFWPKPAVKSAIIKMIRRDDECFDVETREVLYDVTKSAFSYRRKQLVNILSKSAGRFKMERSDAESILAQAGVEINARPENLTVDDWYGLSGLLLDRMKT